MLGSIICYLTSKTDRGKNEKDEIVQKIYYSYCFGVLGYSNEQNRQMPALVKLHSNHGEKTMHM